MNPARGIDTAGIADTGWYKDRIGVVDVTFVHGKMTEASFDHFLAQACHAIDSCADDAQIPMFIEVLEPALMDSRWRKRLAAALNVRAAKLARTRPAYAMVTPSLVVRAALKVFYWAAPPPYPNTVVSTIREGFEFIALRVPGLNASELLVEYERRRAAFLASLGRA